MATNLDTKYEIGDIVIFDGEENRLGRIEDAYDNELDMSALLDNKVYRYAKIKELTGRIRLRNLSHDVENGLIRKVNAFDAGYIHHLFNQNN